ncbi:MAG TPA: methyltransferase domain-containing protein [Gammaproteobacteria bacterium]|nr:methyltransferase domain-containing protein [Gammaproteobacteria bacterium]
MSTIDREKWDERYRSGAYEGRTHPTELLAEWLPRLPRGRALDVACGIGRNALYLSGQGYTVDAVDISSVALERARESARERRLAINWIEADLESKQLPDERYDLIVIVRYTHAALLPHLIERLAPGGHLLCEEHLQTHREVVGPTNARFRMRPNELLTVAKRGLRILYYREGLIDDPDGRTAALAQLVGCVGSPGF